MRHGWAVARTIYGLFFLTTGLWILLSVTTGIVGAPVQPTPQAAAFMKALDQAGFIDPLLAISYMIGGGSLLFERTAPLGLVLLAPSVAVILGFHLFLSGQYLWGPFVAACFMLLAWRYRRSFEPLWTRSAT
jgi:hypothetical protein